ncbi:YbgA family protein [Pseudomonas sp. LRF_L74]|uniref:YbgA family protein n=1 Tax=Pseudomonas sp. LRF_L74 TaxID=3369422 RepID=UPI003F6269F0
MGVPLKLGISACLLGEPVRFNGGHKESRLCSHTLSEHFQLVPVCPEVAIGLGTPREAIRLVGAPEAPRAVGTRNPDCDVSDALLGYGALMANKMNDLCGYIFMQKSPSCGLHRVKVYQANGYPADAGSRGLYARAFCEHRPDLPVEEEGRLNDPVLRENFLARVYAYADWQQVLANGLTRAALTDFHARHKYQLLAHHPEQYKALGRQLGDLGEHDLQAFAPRYFSQLMRALSKCATRGTHSNVLQHLAGYLKRVIGREEKHELGLLIEQYRSGIVPLVVPITLLKHYFRRHPDRYIAEQVYLQPHPETLSLRNSI